MNEWWSYGLSDFLMFSPQAYWRLVARYNAAWWPGQLLGAAACLALLLLARGQHPFARRAVLLVLAAAWAWVGWAFHWQRYAEIFLAAPQVAMACALQAVLLSMATLLRAGAHQPPLRGARATGTLLLLAALLYPLLAARPGHGPAEAEVFGFMPEPTALATLGALVAVPGLGEWPRVVLALLPALSLLLGGATRWLLA